MQFHCKAPSAKRAMQSAPHTRCFFITGAVNGRKEGGAEYLPAGQVVHLTLPLELEYLPTEQVVHLTLLLELLVPLQHLAVLDFFLLHVFVVENDLPTHSDLFPKPNT